MNKLGIIGLGSKSTTYYIELLNLFYNKKHGGFNTCPFTMVNINFNEINPFLPNDFININGNILPYLHYINYYAICLLALLAIYRILRYRRRVLCHPRWQRGRCCYEPPRLSPWRTLRYRP